MKIFYFPSLILLLVISGCASQKNIEQLPQEPLHSKEQRAIQLAELTHWQITGKLAFIEGKKRESASLFWQFDEGLQSQKLSLTTYLGINVLSLTSKNGFHTIEADGEKYQHDDLDYLIHSLTGLTLPVQALHSWLKGISYLSSDKIIYDEQTQLPKTLVSDYDNRQWIIHYADYQHLNNHLLAKKITLKQQNLMIKIHINQWTL